MSGLWPHQVRARADLLSVWRSGARRALVVCPTGGGKTRLGATVARDYLAQHVERGGRVSWLAHRTELVDQAVGTLGRLGLEVGHSGWKPEAPVQVATVQTLLARGSVPPGTLVVADEAHHFAEDNDWSRVLLAYREAGARILGLTATPERGDGNGLAHMFERMIVAAQIKELIAGGFLVPCIVHAPRGGKLKPTQLVREPVEAYAEKTPDGRAIVFAPHEKAAHDYARAFRAAGVRTAVVLGRTPWNEREAALRALADGSIRVVCNVFVLTEGFDCPPVNTVIIARGCQSAGTFIQMTGRGARAWCPRHEAGRLPDGTACSCPDRKNEYHLLDLRGVTYDHGAPDEDRVFSLDGRAIRRRAQLGGALCALCKEPLPDGCTKCPNCAKERDPQTTPKGIGGTLERYAGLEKAGPKKRAAVLAGILRGGKTGHPRSSKAAAVIFHQMFKAWPSGADYHEAHIINAGGKDHGS